MILTSAYCQHMGYTKLFYDIILSTVWREKDPTRLVWITMLAMRNKYHIVEASLPGLADCARVSMEDCQEALRVLSSPDPWSRTKDFEGRRIEEADGGWLILNGEKFRRRMSEEERREKNAIYQRNYRERKKNVSNDLTSKQSQHSKSKRESTEKETEKEPSFIEQIKTNPLYANIEIDRELERARQWCRRRGRRLTQRFFENWLGKADRLIEMPVKESKAQERPLTEEDKEWYRRWEAQHGSKKAGGSQ
jgi:hypothetical protein